MQFGDDFSVGNHSNIDGQTSSDGQFVWERIEGGATALMRTNTSAFCDVVIGFADRCSYRAEIDFPSDDYYVQASINVGSDDSMRPGLLLRKDSSATLTYYDCSVRADTNVVRIRKRVAGTFTDLQNSAFTFNTNTFYLIRFEVEGNTLRAYVDGVQVGADLVDSSIPTGTRCGMIGGVSGATTRTGQIASFEGNNGSDFDETIEEAADAADTVSAELVDAYIAALEEQAGASDTVESGFVESDNPTLSEAGSVTERVTVSLSDTMVALIRESAAATDANVVGNERISAAMQVPVTHSMVVLTHFYLDEGTEGFSSIQVNAPSHGHIGKVLQWGYADVEIPVPVGPPRIGNMRVRFADTDQYFRKKFGAKTPRLRRMDFKVGPEGGKESMFFIPASGQVQMVTFPPGAMEVDLVDVRFRILRTPIPGLINSDNFPNLPEGVKDVFFPILFGRLTAEDKTNQGHTQIFCVDTTLNRYALARHLVWQVLNVWRKRPDETEFTIVPSTDWTLTNVITSFDGYAYHVSYLDFTSDQEKAEIRVDVEGWQYRGAWGTLQEQTGLLRNPIDCFINLIFDQMQTEGISLNFDFQSFADVRETCETLNLFCDYAITSERTFEVAATHIFEAANIDWFPSQRNQIKLALTSTIPTTRPVFTDTLHLERESEIVYIASPTKNRIRYKYDFIPAEGKYNRESVYDNVDDQEVLGEIEEEVMEYPAISDPAVALAVVLERSAWLDQQSHRMQVRIGAPPVMDKVEIANIVGITHYGGLADGGWVDEPFKIIGRRLNLDNLEYELTLIKRVQQPMPPESQVLLIGEWRSNSRVGPYYYAPSRRVFGIFADDRYDFKRLVTLGSPALGLGDFDPVDDDHFPQLDNVIDSFDTRRAHTAPNVKGEIVRCITQESNGRTAYHEWNLRRKLWDVLDEEIIASNSHGDAGCSIDARPDGEVIAYFQGDREQVGATFYRRGVVSRRTAVGVWSTAAVVGEPDAAISIFPIAGIDYGGAVHDRVARVVCDPSPADTVGRNVVRFLFGREEPADVASTQDLETQLMLADNTLTSNIEVVTTTGQGFTPVHVCGDPEVFEDPDGQIWMAIPVGQLIRPDIWMWKSTATVGQPDKKVRIGSSSAKSSADSFTSHQPDIGVRYLNGLLRVVMGTWLSASDPVWAAYKTIPDPLGAIVPDLSGFPRADQVGPTWPAQSMARHGVDMAVVGGRETIFKITSGPGTLAEGLKSIYESIDIAEEIPGDNAVTLDDFIAEVTA